MSVNNQGKEEGSHNINMNIEPNYTSIDHLSNGFRLQMKRMLPQYAITIRFGYKGKSSVLSMQRLLDNIINRYDRKFLGPRYVNMPNMRTESFLVIEYDYTNNPHAHGVIAFHEDNLEKVNCLQEIGRCQSRSDGSFRFYEYDKMCPSGDILLEPITDLDGWTRYCTKTRSSKSIFTAYKQ